MNLADAIRKAALAAGQEEPTAVTTPAIPPTNPYGPNYRTEEVGSTPTETANQEEDHDSEATADPEEEVEIMSFRNGEQITLAEAPQAPLGPTTAVRLELFLAPEQVSSLMRCIVATQHSVMTLREAAHFLRIPNATLEQLATDRGVPAFQVDGKWRFSRATLEEWLSEQGRLREEAS
jgi:excisionase family DNA binding protein